MCFAIKYLDYTKYFKLNLLLIIYKKSYKMNFKEGTSLYNYEVQKEGSEDILYINYLGAPYVPSLSDFPEVMERTIDSLIENSNVSRIIFVQQKNYNYDFDETSMLLEIAQLYVYFIRQEKILSREKLIINQEQLFSKRYNEIFYFLFLLKQDPIAAHSELKRLIVEVNIALRKTNESFKIDQKGYLSFLEKIFTLLEKTALIQKAYPYLKNYRKGSREIYKNIFKPDVIPNFTFTRLVSNLPEDSEIIDQYKIFQGDYDKSIVTILKKIMKSNQYTI